jgi:phosphate acetyltransferase
MDGDRIIYIAWGTLLVGILVSIFFARWRRQLRTKRSLTMKLLKGYFQGDMPAHQLGPRTREIANLHFLRGAECYSLAITAFQSVELILAGQGELLMKGSLHTDELMRPVTASATGLRTGRRISHVFIMDVPTYPETLFITDAAINIFPDLDVKRDIVQNAIDLFTQIGLGKPRVAILSAVETVTTKIPSTIDAAALCKMADRGQITGAIVDGPLAFDNAIDAQAARIKSIHSPVVGRAQILVVPDLEAGNMLAKNLVYLSKVDSAGLVLGARVPIVLTSRADSVRSRMASCAVAVLYASARRTTANGLAL